MKRRWLSIAALALVVAIALSTANRLWTTPPVSVQAPVTVRLSGWTASPKEQVLLKQVIRDFEAQHPTIRVKYEAIANQYMDVIKTRLIGAAAPDVFYLDVSEAPFLMRQNVLEPLNPYLTPEFDLEDFEPSLLNAFRDQDQLYGLPKDYSTLVLFYNKTAFTAAGLTAPPQTWDELRQAAKLLTLDRDKNGRIDQYGYGLIPELPRQAYKIKAFGGAIADSQGNAAFATDAALRGLQPVVEQYRQDHTAALPSDMGATSADELFAQGKVAMTISGNWAIPYLQDTFPQLEFGTAEVPRLNDQPGTMVYTVAYVMNKQAEHKPEAWTLLSYLTGKQGIETWTGTGFALPTRKSVAETLGYDQDPLRAAFVAGVDYAMPWQAGEHLPIITTHFNNQFLSVILGQQALQPAMLKAEATANKQIQANQ